MGFDARELSHANLPERNTRRDTHLGFSERQFESKSMQGLDELKIFSVVTRLYSAINLTILFAGI